MSSSSRREGARAPGGRALAITLAMGFALLVVTALVFTLSAGTRGITAASRSLSEVDAALRVTTAARAQLGLAVHLSAIEEVYGADVDAARATSQVEAKEAFGELDARMAAPDAVGVFGSLREASRRLVEDGNEGLGLLEAGDWQAAQAVVQERIEPEYQRLSLAMVDLRNRLVDRMVEADAGANRVGTAARFLLVLTIPLALVLVYREIVGRQLRQAELEVRLEAERQLVRARDEFVANISHELRTPLTAIVGLGQIVVEDPRLPPEVMEMLAMINGEAADLTRMVEDLLTTARLAAGKLRYEPVELGTVEEAEAVVRPFLQSGRSIRIEVDRATVRVDRLRQRQVLRNLISNAVKYGGPHIRLSGHVDGAFYRWTIADDGPGVPKELENRLFQRFVHQLTFQQAVAGGVGLGLSIVKSLAEGMGGHVRYLRVGEESRFEVSLPLAGAARALEQAVAS
jgi:signal transduction histidine kinase